MAELFKLSTRITFSLILKLEIDWGGANLFQLLESTKGEKMKLKDWPLILVNGILFCSFPEQSSEKRIVWCTITFLGE